jgi:hypothetical protein
LGTFRQDTLQRPSVHVELARRFRNIAAAEHVDALNVFPTNLAGRHRLCTKLDLLRVCAEQSRGYVVGVGIGWFDEIIGGAELYGLYGSCDITVTGEDDCPGTWSTQFQRRDQVKTMTVGESHFNNRKGGTGSFDLPQSVSN